MMPWITIPYKDKRLAKLKQVGKCQSLPCLTILRKNGTIAALDAVPLINEYGVNALTSLLQAEGGFVKTFAPLEVAFDYFGYLKDKYKQDLDLKDSEETKQKWDELPIRPSLRHSAMSGTLPEEPMNPYEKKTFVLQKPLQKAPVNYEDMVIPTVANGQRKMAGTFEEPKNGGLVVTSEDIEKQGDPNKFL
mmetsp:Transcript_10904/g.12361  ORF Transcript_10904/g.12361 Transcript_10904/m.12361 type:complete len:191 (+) Transcript_10904:75-647(+)